jgi:hypothetical protein
MYGLSDNGSVHVSAYAARHVCSKVRAMSCFATFCGPTLNLHSFRRTISSQESALQSVSAYSKMISWSSRGKANSGLCGWFLIGSCSMFHASGSTQRPKYEHGESSFLSLFWQSAHLQILILVSEPQLQMYLACWRL